MFFFAVRGHVTLDFFDGIYGGCCAVSLSSFTAVPAVVAQLNSVLIADSPLSARLVSDEGAAFAAPWKLYFLFD